MAGNPDKGFIDFPGFPLGIDNLSAENAVGAAALREAVNVDLDSAGRPRRRAGYTRVATGEFHSGFASAERLFAVKNGTLTALDENLTETAIVADVGAAAVSYDDIAGLIYWTSPTKTGVIDFADANLPVWPSAPAQPIVTPVLTGGLAEGAYQVAVTLRDRLGRESGATLAAYVMVGEGGGLQLTGLPTIGAFESLCVYVSPANGDVLYQAAQLTSSATYIVGVGTRGRPLGERQWWEPMPAGQASAFAAGRRWVAVGPRLYYSEPLAFGAMLPDNYLQFAQDITLLAPVGEASSTGLYVGAGKRTLYLTGPDPKQMQMLIARPSGAVAGTYLPVSTTVFAAAFPNLPPSSAAIWLAADGVFCLGVPGGQCLPLTQRRVAATQDAERGAVFLREDGGLNQLVSSLQGGSPSQAAASDQLVGTVYRGGIEVN